MFGGNNYGESVASSIAANFETDNNNILDVVSSSERSAYVNRIDDDEINDNFLFLNDNGINLDYIPISALGLKSRELLSKRLNPTKVILSENGVPRDWRGILCSVGLSDSIITVESKNDQMKEVLAIWLNERKVNATVGELRKILGNIDRWDVVDDTNDFFVEDSKNYTVLELKKRETAEQTPEPIRSPITNESNLLTHDDIELARKGLPPRQYDAYLLFDNYDLDFATKIIEKLEVEYDLKLCVKQRDLIHGIIESDTIMRLISERCRRLIAVFSKAFFESQSNSFLVKFAQANSIQQGERKIIPLMFEECDLPASLRIYYPLRYREDNPYFNFWQQLYNSVQSTVVINRVSSPVMPKITITEVDSPSTERAIESSHQSQQSTMEFDTPNTLNRRRKERSKSPKSSSPTTPTSLKKFWMNFPKIGSQSNVSTSMWTLDDTDKVYAKEKERCQSSLSLNNSISNPTPTKQKKIKWSIKKLLSPASAQKLSAESDSSVGPEFITKEKKWYRKPFHSRSKMRQAVADI